MSSFEIMQPVRNSIANAETTDELSDVFCYVVGFLSGELKERIEKVTKRVEHNEQLQGDLEAIASLVLQLAALEAGWEAYKARLGG